MTENLQIGDLAVSGNATVGGDLNIQGKSVLKGDVRVEGWLDADNLKTPCKGLFSSAEKLNEAYPNPTEGWFALVGDTVPADIYVVGKENGENKWAKTGKSGGTIVVETEGIDSEVITQIQTDVSGLNDKTDNIMTDLINTNETLQTNIQKNKDVNDSEHSVFNSRINRFESRQTSFDTLLKIMPLPFELATFPDSISLNQTAPDSENNMIILYNSKTKCFVAQTRESNIAKLWSTWSFSELYGNSVTVNGMLPIQNKVYFCKSNYKYYKAVDGELIEIG